MSTKKKKKAFDCVEMKRRAQERIYADTKGLSPEEEIEYFRKRAEEFWRRFHARSKIRPSTTDRST